MLHLSKFDAGGADPVEPRLPGGLAEAGDNAEFLDQVRAYRGQYERYQVDPDSDFNDVVTSQRTLAGTISTYIQLLGDQWQAVADLAGLTQSDDIFALGRGW